MDKIFNPGSILVIGVSSSPSNMARHIVQNLIRFNYDGRIYLMGRKPGNVAGQQVHTSFDTIPEGIDLAVVLTPAPLVPEMVERCGKSGIRHMAIESGGFSELAEDRKDIEQAVVDAAKRWGIRFVGPNGIGVICPESGVVLPFMPIPHIPPVGRVSLLAQSGGVGIVYLYALAAEFLGMDKFVSMGNKLSLDECDYLDYIGSKGSSDLVCLYLEDIRRGRRFYESIRNFPGHVIVQKANVSLAGAAAAASHTASLTTDDRLVEAALKQAGALRVDDMSTMVHHVMAMGLPPVKGDRILVLSRSGGHAVIAADFAERYGFTLPELPPEVGEIAASSGRAHVIRPANPLDLGDVFDFHHHAAMLEKGVEKDRFDAVVLIHVFAGEREINEAERLVGRARELSRVSGKPIFICYLTSAAELQRIKATHRYPLFSSPEVLISSMAASRQLYRNELRMAADTVPGPEGMDLDAIGLALEKAALDCRDSDGWMSAAAVFEVLRLAGLNPAPYAVVQTADEAVQAAAGFGYPVVMKLLSPQLLHKSHWGGVSLNIKGEQAVQDEFEDLTAMFAQAAPDGRLDGVLVQPMIKGFREVFLGGRRDPSFGPVVGVGFGGTYVEVLNDISFRLCPVSKSDVEQMLAEVNLFRTFHGKNGEPGGDFSHLSRCVFRLSHLLTRFPSISEIDVNPIKLFDAGAGGLAVDGRIRLAQK